MVGVVAEHWDQIMEILQTEFDISRVTFRTFLMPLKVYAETENTVTLLIDDAELVSYNGSFIQNRYGVLIRSAIEEVTGKVYELKFITPDEKTSFDEQKKETDKNQKRLEEANLISRYTFDTFVVGANNKFAHAAALAVAEMPAQAYNPLFIYGGVGLGKTHLMHSIAHHIIDHNPSAKVLYVTSENFTNEVIESIRVGRDNSTVQTEFRKKYRSVDVLLIDDIQFIIGKDSTQAEFFNTFNDLHSSGRQIVISADKPPKDFTTLEERLRSRFEWGLTGDIQQPDYETRMAILQKKEELDGYRVDESVLDYIATNIDSNIRELEGALTKVVAYSKLEHRPIDTSLAEEALKDIIAPRSNRLSAERIIEMVADQYGITSEDLLSTKKSKNIAYPRQVAMYLCRQMTDISLNDIGIALGGRDHSTVIHGIDKVEADLALERSNGRTELTDRIAILRKKLE